MVVSTKKPEKKYIPPDDIRKDNLLAELRNESLGVVELAAMYAKGFELFGEDVTKILKAAEEQQASWQEIYNKGYEDGFYERQRRLS